MKAIMLIFFGLCITIMLQAQVSKTVNVTAGNLKSVLTSEELISVTDLTITGTIDARDFKTMRDDMPVLAELDLSAVTVVKYTGTEGTMYGGFDIYPANTVPILAFCYANSNQGKISLSSIKLPSLISSLDVASFRHCAGLAYIDIPTSVTSIGANAFEGCSGLITIKIPYSVSFIGVGAFLDCTGITSINIPSLVSIENSAFGGCSALKSIYANSIIPIDLSSSPNVFYNVNKTTCKLYVPFGSYGLYAAANQWKDFINIIEMPKKNQPPKANAGFDQSVNKKAIVTLDGSASSDLDGDALTYLWTAPAGITLNSATAAQPTFTTPKVKINTNFTFSLVVNDGIADSPADEVVVTVLRKDNKAPFADAGKDQSVIEGTLVTLDGSASSDKEGDPLTYLWTAPEGVTLSANNVAQPTFWAPMVDKDTHLTFSLVVNDGYLDSKPHSVTVKIFNEKGKKSAEIISEVSELKNAVIKAYPNPFSDRLFFEVKSSENSDVSLEIFNASGSKIESLNKGQIISGGSLRFEFVPVGLSSQLLIYKLMLDNDVHLGKVVYRK